MESRFGLKDFVLCGLMVACIGMVGLAMVQFDRQWGDVKEVRSRVDGFQNAQSESNKRLEAEIAAIKARLAQGAVVSSSSSPQTPLPQTSLPNSAFDPFYAVTRGQKAANYAMGDAWVGGLPVRVAKLTPVVPSDLYTQTIGGFVVESLLQRNEDTLAWEPYIADSWNISADGKVVSYHLRPGVTFSDGSPLTSADVKFTFDWMLNPDVNCPDIKSYYDKMVGVETPDSQTVIFRWSEPYFLVESFTGGVGILSKKFYSQFTPGEFNEKPGLLFGSGPYMLDVDPKDWRPMSGKITLVRNPNYWGPKPALDRLTWIEYANDQARQSDFRAGKLDSYGIPPDQWKIIKNDDALLSANNLQRFTAVDAGYRYIGWNEEREGRKMPFADRRVRQAMTLLTDRERIIKEIYSGIGQVATGPFAPSSPQADPAIKPWPCDLAKAAALLKEAGWEDRNHDGVIEDAAGQPFKFEFLYPSGSKGTDQVVLMIQDAYRQAGIQMEAVTLDWPVFIERINAHRFDAYTMGWGGSVEDDPRQIFHSSSIADGGSNYVSYRNSELDRLIDEARTTMDTAKRNALWRRCHRIFHEDQPYTFLENSESIVLVDKRFCNVVPPKVGVFSYSTWYVPAVAQKRRAN